MILDFARTAYGLSADAFAETIMAARLQADAPGRQADEQAISEGIVAFAGALDADGQPKHPYFAEVEVEMRDLAYADRAKGLHPSLGDLYIKAPPFVHVALCHGLAAVGFGGCVDVGSDGAFIDPARQGRDYQPDRQSIHEDVQRAMQKHGWGQ